MKGLACGNDRESTKWQKVAGGWGVDKEFTTSRSKLRCWRPYVFLIQEFESGWKWVSVSADGEGELGLTCVCESTSRDEDIFSYTKGKFRVSAIWKDTLIFRNFRIRLPRQVAFSPLWWRLSSAIQCTRLVSSSIHNNTQFLPLPLLYSGSHKLRYELSGLVNKPPKDSLLSRSIYF